MSVFEGLELGFGTWAWGDSTVWKYGQGYSDSDLRDSFRTALDSGVVFFDTAEVYGRGKSETFLGSFLKEYPSKKILIATKFMPYPWRISTKALLISLKASLKRLGLESVDLYQAHFPMPFRSVKAWMEPLAEAVQLGLTREVGVSNYDRDQMLRARDALALRNVSLASNQVQYSLVRRKNEFNGLLEECKKSNITFIAYSPLGMGMLSGKYTPRNPPPGPRRFFYPKKQLARIQPLVDLMRRIGAAHGGKTVNQVALNWCVVQGTFPIPGVKNASQAKENAGAMGWRLTAWEMALLNEASLEFKG
jgi:aryl-alcohol dehydrogenase-like predicted oxidoreductase